MRHHKISSSLLTVRRLEVGGGLNPSAWPSGVVEDEGEGGKKRVREADM